MKRTKSRLVTGKDVIALLLVILAVILLENRSNTTIRLFIPQVSAPPWTALLACLLLGGGLGVAPVVRRRGRPGSERIRPGHTEKLSGSRRPAVSCPFQR
jgi:uncharacterized integral membrane protein